MPSSTSRGPAPRRPGNDLELPLYTAAFILVALAALVTGFGFARWMFGGGWWWPATTDEYTSYLAGALTGHPGDGLVLTGLPSRTATYAIAAVLLAVGIGFALGIRHLIQRDRESAPARGRGQQFGFASKSEVTAMLGAVSKRRAAEMRPDLYRSTGRGTRGVDQ